MLVYKLSTELLKRHKTVKIMSPEMVPLIFGPMGPVALLFSFTGNVKALIN